MESDDPPVVRWVDLPEPLNQLAKEGFTAWQAGDLDAARVALHSLRGASEAAGTADSLFHALHLLGCVAFSERAFAESRQLHEQVLSMCDAIGFRGGAGSSLFDLGMIDEAEGNVDAARVRYQAARESFESGGYWAYLPTVRAALDALSP